MSVFFCSNWSIRERPRIRDTVYRDATLCTVNHGYHWSNGEAVQAASKRRSALRENLGYRASGSFPSHLRSIDYPRLGDQPIPPFSWHTTSLHFVRSMLWCIELLRLQNVPITPYQTAPIWKFSGSKSSWFTFDVSRSLEIEFEDGELFVRRRDSQLMTQSVSFPNRNFPRSYIRIQ